MEAAWIPILRTSHWFLHALQPWMHNENELAHINHLLTILEDPKASLSIACWNVTGKNSSCTLHIGRLLEWWPLDNTNCNICFPGNLILGAEDPLMLPHEWLKIAYKFKSYLARKTPLCCLRNNLKLYTNLNHSWGGTPHHKGEPQCHGGPLLWHGVPPQEWFKFVYNFKPFLRQHKGVFRARNDLSLYTF